jgi:hypothetical protein
VGPGAIVVVGAEVESIFPAGPAAPAGPHAVTEPVRLSDPLACVEILGRSAADRMIERFVQAEAELVSVIVQEGWHRGPVFSGASKNLEYQVVSDVGTAVVRTLRDHAQRGIEHSFLLSGCVYAETDVLDLFYFHREGKRAATRARNRQGSLNLWVVDCEKAQDSGLPGLLARADESGTSYFIREYVNCLNQPADLRRWAADALQGRCSTIPSGRKVKPGIWIADGAEVHRRARIVAPAYIGRGTRLHEDTLITRGSNLEECCYIDYGTVIEESSILKNTHVGIWLDVCNSIADGNKLVSLKRDTVLEIADPSVLRSTVRKPLPNGVAAKHAEERKIEIVNAEKSELSRQGAYSFLPILSRGE